MAKDIDSLLAEVGAAALIQRAELVRSLATLLTNGPLDDRLLILALRIAAVANPKLQGPPFFLDPKSRRSLIDATASRCPDGNTGRVLCVLLALDLCGRSIDDALTELAVDVEREPIFTAAGIDYLQRVLTAAGVSLTYSAGVLERIAAALVDNKASGARFNLCLLLCGLQAGQSDAVRGLAFEKLAVPMLQIAAERGQADLALSLEHFIYSQHIKPAERPEHHKHVFSMMAPMLRQLGVAHGMQLGTLPAPVLSGRPKVAFFLHNGHRLAHVEVLLSFLEGYAKSDNQPIEPLIYLLSGEGGAELARLCARYNVEVIEGPAVSGFVQRFTQCRAILQQRNIAAVVFVSLPLYLDYLVGLQLAPVSIWWSMKFPLPNFAGLDGRVFYRMLFAGEIEIDGAMWRGGPLGILPPPQPETDAVAALRAQYSGGPLLGTVAREEKIREPAYLDAVTRILQAHPTANYLWTGRNELPEITAHFRAKGVAERCHFVGWVDPAVYCQAFDLFLETFPLTGLMSGWAMANGAAVVTAGPLGWLGCMLEGIYNGTIQCTAENRASVDAVFADVAGKVPAIWAQDADGFVALANALLADDDLRHRFGLACQRFMTTFLSDMVGSAVIQAQHFADIIAEKLTPR